MEGNCKQRFINFELIPFLLFVVILMAGCAGPIMHTIPAKPFVVETEPKEIPQKVELVLESVPGEVIKNEFYFKMTIQTKAGIVDIFSTGDLTTFTENVSSNKEITTKVTGEVTAGMIGKPIKKVKSECTMIFSNKGKVISTNCPNTNPVSTHFFPDGFISIGSQWNELFEIDDQILGKIQIPTSYQLTKFALISNRLCARIDFKGKNISPLVSKHVTISDMKSKGFYYYDLKLGEIAYAEGYLSMEGFESEKRENFSCTMEINFKLNYTNSMFKRPVISHSASPEMKLPPQGIDITPKPQPPLPEKPQTITPVTPPPVTSLVVVTGTSANVRSGTGNEFPIITTVKQGDKLILLGEYGEWFNVRLENGQEGWIIRRFVKE